MKYQPNGDAEGTVKIQSEFLTEIHFGRSGDGDTQSKRMLKVGFLGLEDLCSVGMHGLLR